MVELGFSITDPRFGPLSQISIPITSVDKCVGLAISAYSWYKTREQIQSFETLLAINKIYLYSSSFDAEIYRAQRQEKGGIWGVLSTAGSKLFRVPLEKASTASEGSEGALCLRALVTALLCIIREEDVRKVLSEILPQSLLRFDQVDKEFRIEGMYGAALKTFVEDVSHEESIDEMHQNMFKILDKKLEEMEELSGLSRVDILSCKSSDISLITGFLRWLFMPSYDNTGLSIDYVTASLRVWSTAVLLSALGFQLETSPIPSDSRPRAESKEVSRLQRHERSRIVHLTFSTHVKADLGFSLLSPVKRPPQNIKRPPRMVPLHAIPALMTMELVEETECSRESLILVEEAFLTAFHKTKLLVKSKPWFRWISGSLPYREFIQKRTSGDHLAAKLSLIVNGRIQTDVKIDTEIQVLMTSILDGLTTPDTKAILSSVIQYATLLAIASEFIRVEDDDESSDDTIEVIYDNCLTTKDLRQLGYHTGDERAVGLNSSDSGHKTRLEDQLEAQLHLLKEMQLLLMSEDIEISPPFGPRDSQTIKSIRASRLTYLRRDWAWLICDIILCSTQRYKEMEIFGAQSNGLIIISQFIPTPSLDMSTCFVYRLQKGQLVDVPMSQGFVKCPSNVSNNSIYCLSHEDIQNYGELKVFDLPVSRQSSQLLHWAVDPCWDIDPSGCCLAIRYGGLLKHELSLQSIYKAMVSSQVWHVACTDSSHVHTDVSTDWERLWGTENWTKILIEESLPHGNWLTITKPDLYFDPNLDATNTIYGEQMNWFIDGRGQSILPLLGLLLEFQIPVAPKFRIVSNCMNVALKQAQSLRESHGRPVLIILED